MPATEAQIRANRENAQKSTGPKTEAGKARARMNALKHGLRSKSPSVLPHEDPAELEARINLWVADWGPRNAIERALVERAAKASWALERAERYEAALISRRVRRAMSGSRAEGVDALGRRLLLTVGEPAGIVAELEGSPEGVRWLLGRWGEAVALLDSGEAWGDPDNHRFVRLLGKRPMDAVDDPALNAIFLAWEVLDEGGGGEFWERVHAFSMRRDPSSGGAFERDRRWRELAPRPADEDEARARLRAVVEGEVSRLNDILAELEEAEGDDDLERAEAASFLANEAGERLRRYQSARSREMFRAIQILTKMRKDAAKLDRDQNGLSPSRGKVAAQRPDEGRSAADSEPTAGDAPDAGRPPHLTPSASVFPREGGRPFSAPLAPKSDDPHPVLRAALFGVERRRDDLAAAKNATNEADGPVTEMLLNQQLIDGGAGHASRRSKPKRSRPAL
ncbi:hypothetical protein [Paludisphaera rhizosphaerae]|uniref:hypothetical protein n=1 Tax=Paludisphaera rhizosphaerae TaxID=2711216 RepID=UPI0013EC1AF5|nr:hypothetical protein [Paludisphaera rhizosphaerae]